MTRAQVAFREMARSDPDLAARLVLMSLPVAAKRIQGDLTYDLTVQGWGTFRVAKHNGTTTVDEQPERSGVDRPDSGVDFSLVLDARTLAEMAAGANPARLMLEGRLRIRGKRRRALKLRAMAEGELDLAEVLQGGAEIDPDLLYRSLEYLIDPEWRVRVPGRSRCATATGSRSPPGIRPGSPMRPCGSRTRPSRVS